MGKQLSTCVIKECLPTSKIETEITAMRKKSPSYRTQHIKKTCLVIKSRSYLVCRSYMVLLVESVLVRRNKEGNKDETKKENQKKRSELSE